MRETINGADLRRMIISAAAAIEINKQALNELNVFPVPDGDTGTNMSMTINSAASDLRKTEDPDLEKASKVAASAMLRGARGNSGVILSLLFRGISKRLKGSEECDGVLWAQALQEGVDAAYKAVMKPAEGTILTVARLSAAKAADAARENNFIEFVHEAAIEEAVKALADTVNQNPVLKKAGVVDAGGKGWVVALEAMLSALQGEDVVLPENGAVTETKQSADFSDFNTEDITFSYCTEFIISRENDHDPENLRAFLSELGDSLVLVDDDEIIKVHVHTNDPGKALTEALNYGSFVTVKIENMRLQHTEKVLSEQEVAPKIAKPEKPLGVVSVCAGAGLADVFQNLGVDQIISGGQTMNPSIDTIAKAIRKANARNVFVLPNNSNIIMAAQQAAELSDRNVIVIPTKTMMQGMAAAMAYAPENTPEVNRKRMEKAAANVVSGAVTYAVRDTSCNGLNIAKGDIIGLKDNTITSVGKTVEDATLSLVEKMLEDREEAMVTLYFGEGVTEEQANELSERIMAKLPDTEIIAIPGGQPLYYYYISVE